MTRGPLLIATILLGAGCGSDPSGTEAGETNTSGPSETAEAETGATETETETGVTVMEACMVDTPIVVLDTSMGTMVVQLDGLRAPITVANFVSYVSSGFYDGTIFHRVLKDFVIQGGGFNPGLEMKTTMGPIPREIDPDLTHVDGAIAMARRNEPDTAESQWYITDNAQPGLDGDYAVFGVLIDGFEVRDAIADVPVETVEFMGQELGGVPVEDVLVNAAYCVDAWP
ncbi:Peptidyl-prolyl cis-trans isomerase cyp18 [Enhygromyxa salina]|uniref:Peptidyl-prolyl cis-trans isomerase n=1 Tax=Enhygromyxa salina TaxID=215803 RepID=A0A2S9XEK7_9BACT|nr:peptidylprolyl isomerase [Enhygromyxa salina]PRP91295.1 Peptidyl-prolyl cis-trans isomerase cyp18 [Enhygromyxa salina]